MTNCVLLSGLLRPPAFRRAEEELFQLVGGGAPHVTLVIDSCGGDATSGNEFILAMELCQAEGVSISARIYTAHSMAALVALSAEASRVMARDGELSFHPPVSRLRAGDFDSDTGDIYRPDGLAECTRRTQSVLGRYGLLSDAPLMEMLTRTDWLIFDANAALARSLVDELF